MLTINRIEILKEIKACIFLSCARCGKSHPLFVDPDIKLSELAEMEFKDLCESCAMELWEDFKKTEKLCLY